MHPAIARRRRQVMMESSSLAAHGEQIAELLAPYRLSDEERRSISSSAGPHLRVERRRYRRG